MRFVAPLCLILAAACASPEARAVAYLVREVPSWSVANRCFSCHNNGDAARALFAAADVPPEALASTLAFLAAPGAWKDNGPDGEFSDPKLSVLQFAFALSAAVEAGRLPAGEALIRAAGAVRDLQEPDGSWSVDAGGLPGSPVTYGRTLATIVARKILASAGDVHVAPARARADGWVAQRRPASVLDAAALLLGGVPQAREEALDLIRRGQSSDGGWGPGVSSPPEVFDTALVLLGLAEVRTMSGVGGLMRRGRDFLEREQLADGSWRETTRPPGAESYAQRISTTGWAVLALRATSAR